MKAVVLLSGGIDSTVMLYEVIKQGYEVRALSFDYGQRHKYELQCAKRITDYLQVEHIVLSLDLASIQSPLLSDRGRKLGNMYVPARNTIFLSHAVALCETVGAESIFIGANADDYNGYPDCRIEYIKAFEEAANLGSATGSYKVIAPLIDLDKQDIVKMGRGLGVNFDMTSSCYSPSVEGKPCLVCDACLLRERVLSCTK